MKQYNNLKVNDLAQLDDAIGNLCSRRGHKVSNWDSPDGLRYGVEINRLGSRAYVELTAIPAEEGGWELLAERESHGGEDWEQLADTFVLELRTDMEEGTATKASPGPKPQNRREKAAARQEWAKYQKWATASGSVPLEYNEWADERWGYAAPLRSTFYSWCPVCGKAKCAEHKIRT